MLKRRPFLSSPLSWFLRGLTLSALALGMHLAHADSGKPIRLWVGFPPGGGTDAVARLVAKKLGERLNQPVLVDNKAGATGTISVISNVAPRLSAERMMAALAGDAKKALAMQDKLVPLDQAIFIEPGLCGAKYGLSLLGKVVEEVRLPLVPVTEPTRQAIRQAMTHAGLIN